MSRFRLPGHPDEEISATGTTIDVAPRGMAQVQAHPRAADAPDEKTAQGASYLIERITPIRVLPDEEAADLLVEDPGVPTAPGGPGAPRPGPVPAPKAPLFTAEPTAAMPRSAAPGVLDVETAYVPLPGVAPPRAEIQDPRPAPSAVSGPARMGAQLVERIRGSKNARLGLIAAAGLGALGLTWLVLGPSAPPPRRLAERPPYAPARTPRPPEEPAQPRPAVIPADEKDRILEKAVLALETGHTDEALAMFRRYAEEDPDPSVGVMIQLLQAQVSQGAREQ